MLTYIYKKITIILYILQLGPTQNVRTVPAAVWELGLSDGICNKKKGVYVDIQYNVMKQKALLQGRDMHCQSVKAPRNSFFYQSAWNSEKTPSREVYYNTVHAHCTLTVHMSQYPVETTRLTLPRTHYPVHSTHYTLHSTVLITQYTGHTLYPVHSSVPPVTYQVTVRDIG